MGGILSSVAGKFTWRESLPKTCQHLLLEDTGVFRESSYELTLSDVSARAEAMQRLYEEQNFVDGARSSSKPKKMASSKMEINPLSDLAPAAAREARPGEEGPRAQTPVRTNAQRAPHRRRAKSHRAPTCASHR